MVPPPCSGCHFTNKYWIYWDTGQGITAFARFGQLNAHSHRRYRGGVPDSPDATVPGSSADEGVEAVEAVSVLADEVRWRLFGFIRSARRPVTREEAAAEAGISAKLAAFHLDKLVAAGLLHARFESPGGVRKVGRKPKVYEPTGAQLRVSIPERRPDVIAEILLDAVLDQEAGEEAASAALRAARRRGVACGAAERARTRPGRLGPERSVTLTEAALERQGFEPRRSAPAGLLLLNCPFHPLAARSPELVCGINHAYLDGFLDGLEAGGVEAVLAPGPGRCCVEFRPAGGDGAAAADGGACTAGQDSAGQDSVAAGGVQRRVRDAPPDTP